MSEECKKSIYGPLGTCVGFCDLEAAHKGPCRVNGVSEKDMLDTAGSSIKGLEDSCK